MFHIYDCLGIKVFPWKLCQSKNGVCDESPPKRWTVAETFAWRLLTSLSLWFLHAGSPLHASTGPAPGLLSSGSCHRRWVTYQDDLHNRNEEVLETGQLWPGTSVMAPGEKHGIMIISRSNYRLPWLTQEAGAHWNIEIIFTGVEIAMVR